MGGSRVKTGWMWGGGGVRAGGGRVLPEKGYGT